ATAIHPPEHCLPGSGWDVIDSQVVPINFLAEAGAGPAGEAKRFIIAKGNQRSLVYFWYHSRGRVIARSHHKIFWMFLDRARLGRTDGSLVRFTVPIQFGDEEAAEATFQEFARTVTPLLSDYVPN
ncbi:MAG: exosortase C-terminal domain/associated protein EpsI, partial [bacterium]